MHVCKYVCMCVCVYVSQSSQSLGSSPGITTTRRPILAIPREEAHEILTMDKARVSDTFRRRPSGRPVLRPTLPSKLDHRTGPWFFREWG